MKVAVLQFPGSNCDRDCLMAVRRGLDLPAEMVWHKETSLDGFDAVVVPGGFSYGDYLRCGAIARFSPVMGALQDFAAKGGPVIGICNGFQILCEAGLLPGALIRNDVLEFRCSPQYLKVEASTAAFSPERLGVVINLPIAHGEGAYFLAPEKLQVLENEGQVLFRYCDRDGNVTEGANPNGSVANIAGIRNREGNVFGMMPHPDRAWEPFHPSTDGRKVLAAWLEAVPVA